MPEDIIQEHFINGLRDDVRMPNNTAHLVTCDGMKCNRYGAVKQASITDGTAGLTTGWPWPQMFKGEGFTLVLDSDKLYYIKSNGTKQELPIYESTVSGSELMADTDMSSWDDSASDWTIAGTAASKVAGSEQSIVDTITALVTTSVYRFRVTVTAVATTASTDTKMYVKIGSNTSNLIEPRIGTMEFDCLGASGATQVEVYGEANAAFTISATSLKILAPVTDLNLATTDKPFTFTEMGKAWILTNSSMHLLCIPTCGTIGKYTGIDFQFNWKILQQSSLSSGDTAFHLGRLYIGGFHKDNARFAESEFTQAFEVFRKKYMGLMYEDFIVDKNVLFFGAMNGGDINAPFGADWALLGFPDSTVSADYADFYIQALREGNMGFVKMPFQGKIYRIEPLGNYLIVYGPDGVAAVMPGDSVPMTFGVRLISNVGLCDYGAVACFRDSPFQMYVGANGKLIIINNELQVRELGYEEFLATLVTNKATAPPILVLEPDESDVFIGNGVVSYVRSREGLGEIWTAITSLYHLNSSLEGVTDDIAPASGKVRMRTAAVDYGNRQYKYINDCEVGAYDVTDLKIRIHYKNDHSSTWYSSEWITVIRGGFAIAQVSGFEFSYELEFTPGANARIEYIKSNWQTRDQRNFTQQSRRLG